MQELIKAALNHPAHEIIIDFNHIPNGFYILNDTAEPDTQPRVCRLYSFEDEGQLKRGFGFYPDNGVMFMDLVTLPKTVEVISMWFQSKTDLVLDNQDGFFILTDDLTGECSYVYRSVVTVGDERVKQFQFGLWDGGGSMLVDELRSDTSVQACVLTAVAPRFKQPK
jgi:hypothetical protein